MGFIWYLLGVLTLPLGGSLIYFLHWSFQKTSGAGACLLGCPRHREYVLGEHYNILVKLAILRREFLASPRHRRASIAYWQERKDKGYGVHPRVLRKLE